LRSARRGAFDILLVWSADRIARSTRHFLEVLDALTRLGVQYISFREELNTTGPLGRAIVTIVAAVAELERNLIRERVMAGMRRARLEGRTVDRRPPAASRSNRAAPPSLKTAASAGAWARSPRLTASQGPRSTGSSTRKCPSRALFQKGSKNRLVTPTKQTAGFTSSGRSKRCGLWNNKSTGWNRPARS